MTRGTYGAHASHYLAAPTLKGLTRGCSFIICLYVICKYIIGNTQFMTRTLYCTKVAEKHMEVEVWVHREQDIEDVGGY